MRVKKDGNKRIQFFDFDKLMIVFMKKHFILRKSTSQK